MAIQIRGVQIQDASIAPGKLDLTATYAFTGTVTAPTPTAGSEVATKAYVDGQLPDSFSGGDGISIDTSGDPDVIAVDLATNSGMQFTSNKLDLLIAEASLIKDGAGVKVKRKAETGGTISVDANGIYIADLAISNAKLAGSIANDKLANSTISGVALGSNLNSLSAGNGISMTSYNGSAGVSDLTIDLDGASLAVGASGISVADGGVSASKLDFEAGVDFFSPNGSTAAFNLAAEVPSSMFGMVLAYKNGLLMKSVQSAPADADEYSVSTAGGVTTVTFGANLSADDTLDVRSFQLSA